MKARSSLIQFFNCLLAVALLLACMPAALAEGDPANGFSILFNPDGATGVTAGQQGAYPVWALEDMNAKENTVTVNGETVYTVQGSNNPKANGENAKGVIPDTGAAMYVVAPADGVVTVSGINGTNKDGTGKTFWQVRVNAAGEITEVTSMSDPGEVNLSVAVKAGETMWFYCNGSKFQFAGIEFTADAPAAAAVPAAAEAFTLVLNPNGATGVAAGQQGAYPVWALEDMSAKENTVTVNGETVYTVQGSNNPKTNGENAKGVIPDTGAAMYVVAPADGVVTVSGINGTNKDGTGKTFWQVRVNAAGEITEVTSMSDPGEVNLSVAVKAGETMWFYCNGSKFQFAAISFAPDQPAAADTSFTVILNADGTAAVPAGQMADAPIFVLEDMKAKDSTVTVNGETVYTVQGSNNPKAGGSNAKGVVPDTGAAISVTAPADGTITVYGVNGTNSSDGSGKTFWVVPAEGEAYSLTDPGEIAVSYAAEAGETVWFYAAGSKFQFAAVTFADANAAPVIDTTPKADDRPWEFVRFGTSTSDAANRLGEGSDVKDKVTLYACVVAEDGTVAKKGGKFVSDAPADGVSFYYTTINPSTENFILTADVTIDYMNPLPDGQEGFALQVRDTIAGSGSYYSNTVSIGSSKLYAGGVNTYNVLGVRNYVGITDAEDADKNKVMATLQAFTDDPLNQVQQGATYRVQLEKTSYAYIVSQFVINPDGTTGPMLAQHIQYIPSKDAEAQTVSSYAELNDPMCVQEADTAYVALVAARGMNVTYSNISFMTSPWNAADWHPQPITYVEGSYKLKSATSAAVGEYELFYQGNADGTLKVIASGEVLDEGVAVKANEVFAKKYPITGSTTYLVEFTPDPEYKPSAYERLSSYDTEQLTISVTVRKIGNEDGVIYVSADGKPFNKGTSWEDALNVQTALKFAAPGQTILLKGEYYDMAGAQLLVERGRDGTADAPITMTTDGGFATFDFGRTGTGFTCWGDWWNISYINICNTLDLQKGMQLAGSNCTLERMNFYNNGTTGLQISGTSNEPYGCWPANNTIINCTSFNNGDSGYEDADGFAAKLTCGPGNVFVGCIAAYNADDGWDMFAKSATGAIGAVTIRDCVTYRNGYLMVKPGSVKTAIVFADIAVDENGSLTFVGEEGVDYTMIEAGNGNGFKMGGTNIPGDHKLYNSISYENKSKGIDSNSCPDIKVYDSTSFNNGSYNVAFYTNNKSGTTGYAAEGVLSFRTDGGTNENLKLQKQSSADVYGEFNFYWTDGSAVNTASIPVTVSADWFVSLDTSVEPSRHADGSIDMHGLLLLTDAARVYEAGAQGAAWGQTEQEKATFWVVGDSTVCGFSDSYYLPRQGWGEQLDRYFSATVYNLAHSGASSRDFTGMSEYDVLLNGSDTAPALGDAAGEKFLLIGFGHNDEKTEAARYTNPNGDYLTEGSFANSLYVSYVKPALDKGVTPVLVTPIVRLTTDNTAESYAGASGHVTADTTVGEVTYAGGDYAQAIRDMAEALDLICIDLTKATAERNVAMGEEAQWLHAWNGAKYASRENPEIMVPKALDKTHTNSYGAKMNAWHIAQLSEGTALAKFVKAGKVQPSYEADFASAVNPDYVPVDYAPPTTTSANWPVYTDAQGQVWYGTVFGDVGGENKITNGSFFASEVEGGMNIGVTGNAGKISSATDGMIFYYTQLPAGTAFTLTATATINDMAANNQVSFGLMARDDLYIDAYVKDTMGDYVAVGTRNQGAFNGFGRKSGVLVNGPAAEVVYGIGDTVELKIVGTADGFTLTYGDNTPVSAGFDYALTSVDSDNIYVGFYAVRNVNVTFTNVKLVLD